MCSTREMRMRSYRFTTAELCNAQNPLHQFPRNFSVDVRNKSVTGWQQVCCVVVMEFGKRHDTTDTADFCPRQLVTDLSFMFRTCYEETGVVDFGLNNTIELSEEQPQRRHKCTT